MPTAFQKELVTLAHRPADLSDLVASALEEATHAVLESDHTLGGRAGSRPLRWPRARTRRVRCRPCTPCGKRR
ncbi:hypothetical protein DV20_28090 [Amycolatopsis rifamycinica]|uniref:Uncharacterized protein n=1 Tax=Amycolatopsis rifamycinica TaxID=287986 RepID=A0A066TZ80_9PSEU|nr:hypothetical protein DV20_28090 [Amycolatopsis rifamycinica]